MALDPNRYAYIIPWQTQFCNKDGHPLSAGFVEIFVNNTTGTQYISYQNWLGDQNPFRIPLDSLGKCTAIGDKELHYDIYVYNYLGNLEFSRINVVTTNQYGGQVIHDETLTGMGTSESPLSATPVINGLVRYVEPGTTNVHTSVVATDPNDGTKTYAISVDDPDLSNYVQFSDLATVAITGSYNDLTDKPAGFDGDYTHLINKPLVVDVEFLKTGMTTELPVTGMSFTQTERNLTLTDINNGHTLLGSLVPNPPVGVNTEKVLKIPAGQTIPVWTDPSNNVAYVSTNDTYDTVNNYRLAGYEVILRVYPVIDNPLHQDFRLSQYNPDGSMYFTCVDTSYGTVYAYRYVLGANGTWVRNDTSVSQYGGILISGIGRNLHLNQNNYVQTNIPGGMLSPTSSSWEVVGDFAGAFKLLGRANTNGTYDIGLRYTASGTSGTYSFIGKKTATVAGSTTPTITKAVYISETVTYNGVVFGDHFDPTINDAFVYDGLGLIGPLTDCTIAIFKDGSNNVQIAFTAIEVGKVGATN